MSENYDNRSSYMQTNVMTGLAAGGLYGYFSKPYLSKDGPSQGYLQKVEEKLIDNHKNYIRRRQFDLTNLSRTGELDGVHVSEYTIDQIQKELKIKDLHKLSKAELQQLPDKFIRSRAQRLGVEMADDLSTFEENLMRKEIETLRENTIEVLRGKVEGGLKTVEIAKGTPKDELIKIIRENSEYLGIENSDKAAKKFMRRFFFFKKSPASIERAINKGAYHANVARYGALTSQLDNTVDLFIREGKKQALDKGADFWTKFKYNSAKSAAAEMKWMSALKWGAAGALIMGLFSLGRLMWMDRKQG